MRRQHVVIGGDDGEIGGRAGTQILFFMRSAGGKTMCEMRAVTSAIAACTISGSSSRRAKAAPPASCRTVSNGLN
jgi:hypothetical protein